MRKSSRMLWIWVSYRLGDVKYIGPGGDCMRESSRMLWIWVLHRLGFAMWGGAASVDESSEF